MAKTVELDRVIDDKLLANRARYELVVDLLHGKTFNFGSPNFGSPRVPALGGVSFFQPKRFETSTGTWPLPGVMQQFGFPVGNNPLQPGLQLNPYGLGFDGSLDFSGINSGRIPWYFIGVVHYLECNADFRKHLHNGDPLTGYTVKHPARRPKVGHPPPFTWEESAVDALKLKQLHTKSNWNLPFVLRSLEAYNGFGYYNNKRGNTP